MSNCKERLEVLLLPSASLHEYMKSEKKKKDNSFIYSWSNFTLHDINFKGLVLFWVFLEYFSSVSAISVILMQQDQSNFHIFMVFITLYKQKPHFVFVFSLFLIPEIKIQSIIFLINMWQDF